jgi:Protein of unknown function (DUF3105)
MLRRLRTGRLALALVMTVVAAGCGAGTHRTTATAGGCAPSVQERLDPRSTQHLFPGAAEPRYLTDPPTSGPHQLGPPPTGAVPDPIPRPRQVAMLETGFVIVQYHDLSAAERSTLAALAGSLVTVAPAVGTLRDRVVATAWTWKQVCRTVDSAAVGALRDFIAAHKGKGFSRG